MKLEINQAKEYLSKMGGDINETREKLGTKEALYQFLDDETRSKVTLKDVKISLLMEHIEKAKSSQMELLKGPVKQLNREADSILNEIIKTKSDFEKFEG